VDVLMVYPREVLTRLRWKKGEDLGEARISYVHRGAPGDLMTIGGSDILDLGKEFFETGEAMIPYHRISKIEYRGEVLFEKPARK
jgi:uncharacterized protein (UPF0248 family)